MFQCFRYSNHKWSVSFLRQNKKLGLYLNWKNVSEVKVKTTESRVIVIATLAHARVLPITIYQLTPLFIVIDLLLSDSLCSLPGGHGGNRC